MLEALKGLAASKKFWTTIIGITSLLIGKIGWNVSDEVLWQVAILTATLTGAQGMTDWGKAAKSNSTP